MGEKVGFFPANRTECRELDLDEYKNENRKIQPMFPASEAPALPDPMVKAGKILGISEQEAHALAPKQQQQESAPASRQDRAHTVGGEFLTSPRKALNVMVFFFLFIYFFFFFFFIFF
jgi:hypothetical protein